MEIITKYRAVDGKEFSNENECLKYELLIKRVDEIMSTLPPIPEPNYETTSFTNGGGYLQHKSDDLRKAKIALLGICKEYSDHKWIQETIDNEQSMSCSFVARILGELGIYPLIEAWNRFSSVDNEYREWGQPYFANNPEKGEQRKLN